MRVLLEQWTSDDSTAPVGRWAIEHRHDRQIIGGASLLPLPPGNHDLEIAWQLNPTTAHRDDHAAEIAAALASWAFNHDIDEVFAAVRPNNPRTAANATAVLGLPAAPTVRRRIAGGARPRPTSGDPPQPGHPRRQREGSPLGRSLCR